jgi:agmatine deiminase
VHVIAGNAEAMAVAQGLVDAGVHVELRQIGDVWLRDTGCIILKDGDRRIARNFGFNGWGNRFDYPGDTTIGHELAADFGFEIAQADWIFEGGSIDVDGEGLCHQIDVDYFQHVDAHAYSEEDAGYGSLALAYALPWPLHVVVDSAALAVFQDVHRFLRAALGRPPENVHGWVDWPPVVLARANWKPTRLTASR